MSSVIKNAGISTSPLCQFVQQTTADQPAAQQKEHHNSLMREAGKKRQYLIGQRGIFQPPESGIKLRAQMGGGNLHRGKTAQYGNEDRVMITLL
jgi:hypothetical protein